MVDSIFHGNPSGVDNTVSVFGGAVLFQKNCEMRFVVPQQRLRFLIVSTNVEHDTKSVVADVKKRYDCKELHKRLDTQMKRVDSISQRGFELLKVLFFYSFVIFFALK